jgi:flagellar hook-associated protein 1 FlgK
MSDLLSIGLSGVRAYRQALATTGDNIANAQTTGYVRRSIRTEEVVPAGDIIYYRNPVQPGGVRVAEVTRAVDEWLVADARVSISAGGRSETRLNWLEAGERALDDSEAGVGAAATRLFNQADTLSSDPANLAARSAFLASVDQTAAAFRYSAGQLASTADGIAATAGGKASQFNTDVATLSRINDALRRAREGTSNQASLLDERDRLIDSIAQALPVTTSFDAKGAVTLTLAGSGNPVILDGTTAATASLAVAADGRLTFSLSTGGAIAPASGSFAGFASAAAHIADQRAGLDTLAAQFASDLNAAHQAGFDANGNPGGPLLSYGGSAAALTALALTPDRVAAADALSANGNLLAMSSLRGTAGVEAGWAGLVAANSQTVANARSEHSATVQRRDGAIAARDQVSEVDLDREAADLLRFQQAYEGSARVIQVARETFQTILNAL